jgi:radical SAM superfamily enzyme YgiQ (UPF0313 family)
MKHFGNRELRETGAMRKPFGDSIPVALVFPNVYRIGMSNLGFQFLYGMLNADSRFAAERFFYQETGTAKPLKTRDALSVESRRPLADFSVIALSIPFENDYPHAVEMLIAGGIEPEQSRRTVADPLVIAGGVAVSLNPEPMAAFLDAIFVGEPTFEENEEENLFFSRLAEAAESLGSGDRTRQEILDLLRDVPSVYVPSAYTVQYNDYGAVAEIIPDTGYPDRIAAAKRRSEDAVVPVSMLFSPDAEFADSLLVETNRGCARGCRFCAAGWIHRPVRHAKHERFKDRVTEAVCDGKTIGLVGSDLARHPELETILESIISSGGRFSLSSIRPDGLTPRAIALTAATGQKTATLAPETASDHLKRVIGKEIPNERFIELSGALVEAGIPNLRFYFLIGLPTETEDDMAAIVDLVTTCRERFTDASRPRKRIGAIGVQVNPFVPKPWTPFQWAAMEHPKVLEKRVAVLRKGLGRTPNVTLRVESPREALRQAVLSRGDRRTAAIILNVARQGGTWTSVLTQESTGQYALRERPEDELFPWDIIDHGVSREKLRQEYERAVL